MKLTPLLHEEILKFADVMKKYAYDVRVLA